MYENNDVHSWVSFIKVVPYKPSLFCAKKQTFFSAFTYQDLESNLLVVMGFFFFLIKFCGFEQFWSHINIDLDNFYLHFVYTNCIQN